ncbi:RNA-directed DNA polymerase from transposon BS [Paramuricea clavata]|uniref:RNA-directed DNA polymerase from transposon BS n=1 Tax=Paramuricea clavata TaxID=317549 RepID=A0A7D9DCV8_PARCT|nr:RNA-directed DNA polymerase from transposon BS [Paramuricea clavata]
MQTVDNINPSTKTKDQGNRWSTVPKTRNKAISSNITSNVNGNATDGVAECTWCQNNFLVLDDLNESCRIIDEMQIKNRIGSDGSNEGKDKPPASKRQQARVQNDKKTERLLGDMSDYIKPVLRQKPDTVILHVGTSSTTNKEACEIVNDIDRLCQEVKEIDPNVEIILSELINREDNAKAKTNVQEPIGKVPTLYSKISDTEPSCSIEKIIQDPFPNASENFQNLEIENENNINFLRSLKGFRVGHINIASLVKHIDELKIYLEKEPFDILSINESRLDETISTDVVSIPGYEMIVKNRNRVGGGVAIYYCSVLNVMNRQDFQRMLKLFVSRSLGQNPNPF